MGVLLTLLVPGLHMGGGTAVVAQSPPIISYTTDLKYTHSATVDLPYTQSATVDFDNG